MPPCPILNSANVSSTLLCFSAYRFTYVAAAAAPAALDAGRIDRPLRGRRLFVMHVMEGISTESSDGPSIDRQTDIDLPSSGRGIAAASVSSCLFSVIRNRIRIGITVVAESTAMAWANAGPKPGGWGLGLTCSYFNMSDWSYVTSGGASAGASTKCRLLSLWVWG